MIDHQIKKFKGGNMEIDLSNSMTTKLRLGKYQHYKGNLYEVIGVAKHSETLEELVVYRAQSGEHDLWVRPLEMFLEMAEIGGKKVPRFRFVEE